jgi:hypothetical protein
MRLFVHEREREREKERERERERERRPRFIEKMHAYFIGTQV